MTVDTATIKLTDLFLDELEREASSTRRTLERVPEGRNNWKPHPKSMEIGYLAALVATMPSWIVSMVKQDELDLTSPEAASFKASADWRKREELIASLEAAVAQAREAMENTNDEHLLKTWRLKVGGNVVAEGLRHIMIRESVFSHLAHHRGQLTVYLRLNDAAVPAIYGPSADEGNFG